MSKATQAERVLNYIETFGSITHLKRQGYPIKSEVEAVQNRFEETCYIKRYSLAGGES